MVHPKVVTNHFANFMTPHSRESFGVVYFFHPFCAIRIVQRYDDQEVEGINVFAAEGIRVEETDLKKKNGIKKS